MCTVTFAKTEKGFCITSNRDEKIARARAIPPTEYLVNNKKVVFPKDPQAGGTWFAHDYTNSIVLLNGAKEKHIAKPNYRKSRGLIVLDLISSNSILETWESIQLEGIEPFTLVCFFNSQLFQMQWNEIEKTCIELDMNNSYIWSSSTLYSKEIREKRKEWFQSFISKNTNNINPKALLDFHQFTEKNNDEYGLQINRNNILKTISVTQAIISKKAIEVNYIDLF